MWRFEEKNSVRDPSSAAADRWPFAVGIGDGGVAKEVMYSLLSRILDLIE